MPPSVYKPHIRPTIDLFGTLNAFPSSSWWYTPTIPRWPSNELRSSGNAWNTSTRDASGSPWGPSYGVPSRVSLPRFLPIAHSPPALVFLAHLQDHNSFYHLYTSSRVSNIHCPHRVVTCLLFRLLSYFQAQRQGSCRSELDVYQVSSPHFGSPLWLVHHVLLI